MDINELVVSSLKNHHGVEGPIWTIENADKYAAMSSDFSDRHRQVSEEILRLMTSLNLEGISRADMCATPCGKGALGGLLRTVADDLVELVGQGGLHYVELGPEPIKTSALIHHLLESGTKPLHYTAVDINETSQSVMREVVAPLLAAPEGFRYLATDFRTLRRRHIECGQDMTLITMLGFQEGNELPHTIGEIIQRVGGARTYVLSEMQLSTPEGDEHIHRFYRHDSMRRFSDLMGIKLGFEKTGNHEVIVSEIEYDSDRYRVAATLLPVSNGTDDGYLLTNICLKYTREQFNRVRRDYGGCRVIGEYCSGDGSVLYQLSEYCADHSLVN
ncbi:hypothetical protein [Pseudomonas poae]|uniref:Histidine-specific methyltransferase SAM-dependent domain-containing protein n=1 Tax=Pseudomonas poae TaxID=200451 RepID=A0A2S9ETR7_9PSED|nr:hypothetical protein [Pseudomonas poae]PRA28287.1 hypothetical protein CQZ97_15265 [Pseudomonas poae]PRC19280.1 hypothetical protein CQZ99_10885 [Pseudomonas poae]